VTDGLTEVYNARFLRTALRRELRRASRFGQELSLVLVEPDRLDAFREEHGDLRASGLLKELARCWRIRCAPSISWRARAGTGSC